MQTTEILCSSSKHCFIPTCCWLLQEQQRRHIPISKLEDLNLVSGKPIFYIPSSGLTNLPPSPSYIWYAHVLSKEALILHVPLSLFFPSPVFPFGLFSHFHFLITSLLYIKTSLLMNHQLTWAILQYCTEYSTCICTSQTPGHFL